MIALTAIVAVIFELGVPLTDADQNFYSHRPVEWIEEEPSLEDVEVELNYRDALKRLEQIYPHIGGEE